MKSVNEQFADMQKKTLESLAPMKNMNIAAANAFERIARKNYDLMGDLVDYAVAQVKTPVNSANLQEAYEQSVADTKAFAEKVNARTAEYVSLAGELSEMAKQQVPATLKAKSSPAIASPVAEKSKPAAEKATGAPAKAAAAEATPAAKAESKTTPAVAKKKAPASTNETAKAKSSSAKASPAAETAKAAPVAKAASKAAPAAAKKKATAKKTTAKAK